MLTVNQGEQYLISPITKEKIPANSISSHTKYGKIQFRNISFVNFCFKLYLIQHGFNDEKKKLLNNMKKNKFMNLVYSLIYLLFIIKVIF
jgi:hypothetical protein